MADRRKGNDLPTGIACINKNDEFDKNTLDSI